MEVFSPEDVFVSVAENGYGKRTEVGKYRLQKRGGKGVINMQTSERNGNVIYIGKANEGQIMLITEHGITIRSKVDKISVIGRNTQGVRLVRLEEGDKVASVATVVGEEAEEETKPTELEQAAQEKPEEKK